jgi:hypothetical protein
LCDLAINIHLTFDWLRSVTDGTRGIHAGVIQGPKPELVTTPTSPPAGIGSPEWVAKHVLRTVNEDHRLNGTDRANGANGRENDVVRDSPGI